MTVTRNRFSSSSCIEPEIEPMAQQRVFKFFQDHSLPFTFREKEVKNVKRFRWQSQIVKLQLSPFNVEKRSSFDEIFAKNRHFKRSYLPDFEAFPS
mgnify:CR=1 FL=1